RTRASILDNGVPEERVHIVLGDLTDEEVQKRLVESTIARWGHLDVLVNSAAASITNGKRGFEADDDAYMKTMDVNLKSVMQLVRLARPYLIHSQGEIVNVSSISALKFGIKYDPYYAISKAGLDQLTRSLAIDLIEYDVRVNGVSRPHTENFFKSSHIDISTSEGDSETDLEFFTDFSKQWVRDYKQRSPRIPMRDIRAANLNEHQRALKGREKKKIGKERRKIRVKFDPFSQPTFSS
ncbi:oxidoreductase, short chain dehydrogenase/reductase family protein, partial [Cooperia oncophora]